MSEANSSSGSRKGDKSDGSARPKRSLDLTVVPVDVAHEEPGQWYWAGLLRDCPVRTAYAGGVCFSKITHTPAQSDEWSETETDPHGSGLYSATIDGTQVPGGFVQLTDDQVRCVLDALSRRGIRVSRDASGDVKRAEVANMLVPANPEARRAAQVQHGLVPLSRYAYLAPVPTDERGAPKKTRHLEMKLPDPLTPRD